MLEVTEKIALGAEDLGRGKTEHWGILKIYSFFSAVLLCENACPIPSESVNLESTRKFRSVPKAPLVRKAARK